MHTRAGARRVTEAGTVTSTTSGSTTVRLHHHAAAAPLIVPLAPAHIATARIRDEVVSRTCADRKTPGSTSRQAPDAARRNTAVRDIPAWIAWARLIRPS